ncbi:nuclear transport factor 2 family protein [Agrobacterium sp. Azo12]|uniref:nuclear transport factor 2 family protein n=1 Tax=Agrobacterium sp. Azo12 TaxID=3031129 RepID=UPI0023D7DA9A|nr:nuclear transport factor 2 family protein [Agrobacterium sp. Azo12]MDO5895570.1 nuclear transport factor 2 family protein [Agrobacterium sp. Azo12]
MSIQLPKAIATYFAADREGHAADIANCFLDTAFVRDEGNTYLGRDEIRRWKEEASTKYQYTATPFNITTDGARTVVTSHLSGNFPGSPVDLRYAFVLSGDQIEQLEITL